MYILQCGEYNDIIGWTPSGLAFVIIDTEIFERNVLPEFFKEANFSSFYRKVSWFLDVQVMVEIAFKMILTFPSFPCGS